jgi:glycosyltransferase involved in cell wall biosynthesis
MRKKIVIVNEKFGRFGGAEQNIETVCTRMAHEYDLAFVYSTATGFGEQEFNHIFPKTFQIDFDGESSTVKKGIRNALAEIDPDLIYLHKCLSIPVYEELLASAKPVVHMEHDHEVYCLRGSKTYPLSRKICTRRAGVCCLFPGLAFIQSDPVTGKLGFKKVSYCQQQERIRLDQQCNSFIVASSFMHKELILQGYPESKITIIPPVSPAHESSAKAAVVNHRILYVGQILKGKGLDCLIRSLGLVKESFELIVIGKGNYLETCRSLAKELQLEEKIKFVGYLPPQELAAYYQSCSFGVVPSVWPEPFGAVGIEMMRYGKAVVGFDSGGISDWLKDGLNGYLIPWMDLHKMAERISELLRHPAQAQRMGLNGKEFASEQYDFHSCYQLLKGHLDRWMTTSEKQK